MIGDKETDVRAATAERMADDIFTVLNALYESTMDKAAAIQSIQTDERSGEQNQNSEPTVSQSS